MFDETICTQYNVFQIQLHSIHMYNDLELEL